MKGLKCADLLTETQSHPNRSMMVYGYSHFSGDNPALNKKNAPEKNWRLTSHSPHPYPDFTDKETKAQKG